MIGERIRDVFRRLQRDAIRQDQRSVLAIQAIGSQTIVAINVQQTPALHGLIVAAARQFRTVDDVRADGDQYGLLFGPVDDSVSCGVAVLQRFVERATANRGVPAGTQLLFALAQGRVTERSNGNRTGSAIETVEKLIGLNLSTAIPHSGELSTEEIAALFQALTEHEFVFNRHDRQKLPIGELHHSGSQRLFMVCRRFLVIFLVFHTPEDRWNL